jgi:hypothetical protein
MSSGTAIATPDVRGKLGFYGCPVGRGRLVRVEWTGEGKPPRQAEVECPACDSDHRIAVSWREPTALDSGRGVDLTLETD